MHGIGGRTIAEAQASISYPEFLTWAAYRNKRGTLNVGLRVDRSAALLAALYANSHGGRKGGGYYSIEDFMPFLDRPEEEIDLDTAVTEWT